MEKEAEEEAKEQLQKPAAAIEEEEIKDQQQGLAAAKEQQQDDEKYDTVLKIKLVHKGKHVKVFRVTGNLSKSDTKIIMDNIAPHIEMRTKVIYPFKLEIHRGGGEIVGYSKTLTSPPGTFTSLEEIQVYIEECEQKSVGPRQRRSMVKGLFTRHTNN